MRGSNLTKRNSPTLACIPQRTMSRIVTVQQHLACLNGAQLPRMIRLETGVKEQIKMKRKSITRMAILFIFAVAALGFWTVNTVLAQDVPGTDTCRAAGPPLEETMKYVTVHANLRNLSLDRENGTLSYEGGHGFGDKPTLHYMKIRCSGIYKVAGTVFLSCRENVPCFFFPDGSEPPGKVKADIFEVLGGSPDALDNLVRALSHLIYLLQADYRASHKNNNDPFAPTPDGPRP